MRYLMRKRRNQKAGLMMNPSLFLIQVYYTIFPSVVSESVYSQMPKSRRNGMMRKTVTGFPPTVANPKCSEGPGCGEWKRCVVFSYPAEFEQLIMFLSRPFKVNPDYKGKWYAPMIDNPAYKGEWAPKKIPNPDWFEDLTPINSRYMQTGIGVSRYRQQ